MTITLFYRRENEAKSLVPNLMSQWQSQMSNPGWPNLQALTMALGAAPHLEGAFVRNRKGHPCLKILYFHLSEYHNNKYTGLYQPQ